MHFRAPSPSSSPWTPKRRALAFGLLALLAGCSGGGGGGDSEDGGGDDPPAGEEDPPVADFAADPTSGDAPLVVQFTDASTGTIDAWGWDFGDGTFSAQRNPLHTYTDPGTYTVTLAAFGPGGVGQKTAPNLIVVGSGSGSEGPSASFDAAPTSGSAPLVVQFTDTSTGTIDTYAWDFGDGATSSAQDPAHTYTDPGTYTVSLTVSGTDGSDVFQLEDGIVVQAGGGVTAGFGANPTSGTAPLVVQFTDTSTGPVDTWSWDFGDGTGSSAPNPAHTYTTEGTYSVSLTVSGGGSSDTFTLDDGIVVGSGQSGPTANFSGTPTSGVAPLTVQFTDQSIGTVDTWSWDFGDGTTSQQRDPSHVYTLPGTYDVTLTVSGSDGSDSATRADYVTVASGIPCDAEDASGNTKFPLKDSVYDFVQVTPDGRGFYCVYSVRNGPGGTPVVGNNVGIFLFELDASRVLVFGLGYGDLLFNGEGPLYDAAHDMAMVDEVIQGCMGRVPSQTAVVFWTPHGHGDHVHSAGMRELRNLGYVISDIYFHDADEGAVVGSSGWTSQDTAAFRPISGPDCTTALWTSPADLGWLWIMRRSGHTGGSVDVVIDVDNDPNDRIVILGSAPNNLCDSTLGSFRYKVLAHGNVRLP